MNMIANVDEYVIVYTNYPFDRLSPPSTDMHTYLPLQKYNKVHIRKVNGGLSRLSELYPNYRITKPRPESDFFFTANATFIGDMRISVRNSAHIFAENDENCFLCKYSFNERGLFSYKNTDTDINKDSLIVGNIDEKYTVSSSGVSFMLHMAKQNLIEFGREFQQFESTKIVDQISNVHNIEKDSDFHFQMKKLILYSMDICDMFSTSRETDFSKQYIERILMFKILENFLTPSEFNIKYEHNSSARNHITKAIDYIYDFSDRTIISADVANYVGVSNRYLQKIFREEVGLTPTQAIKERRLELAYEALKQGGGNKSVRDIALRYGFTNIGGFSGLIRQKYGRRPLDILRFG